MKGFERVGLAVLALCLVVVAGSCGDSVDPEPPPPMDPSGFLTVTVTLDQADVGALIVRISGDPAPDSIRGAGGLTVHHAPAPRSVRAFIAGPLPDSGTVFRFWTSDTNLLGRYTARIEEAAGTDYEQLLPSVASVRVTR